MTVRIGYMGIPFSNSEEMARRFASDMGADDAVLVPLVTAEGVAEALLSGDANFGVVAIRNSAAGTVGETERALNGRNFRTVIEGDLRIHHCLFTKNGNAQVTCVSSHPQALAQCRETLRRLYPDAETTVCEDTAKAAEMLSSGMLPDGCAVICRRSAGEHYGLHLAHENIEDSDNNVTRFWLISL